MIHHFITGVGSLAAKGIGALLNLKWKSDVRLKISNFQAEINQVSQLQEKDKKDLNGRLGLLEMDQEETRGEILWDRWLNARRAVRTHQLLQHLMASYKRLWAMMIVIIIFAVLIIITLALGFHWLLAHTLR